MKTPNIRSCILRPVAILAAGIVATAATAGVSQSRVPIADARISRVHAFFEAYGCAAPNYAADYVRAADQYDIDYRILPAISLLETTCGSHQRLNNHWGWNSARTGFPSVVHGIAFIARQLGQGRAYKDRDLDGKLWAYNPKPAYLREAKRLMREIEIGETARP